MLLSKFYMTIMHRNNTMQVSKMCLACQVSGNLHTFIYLISSSYSAVKQDQSEKKNAALQETVHEMDAIADKLKKRLQEDEETIKNRDQDGQKKDYEITSLKNKIVTLQEQIVS